MRSLRHKQVAPLVSRRRRARPTWIPYIAPFLAACAGRIAEIEPSAHLSRFGDAATAVGDGDGDGVDEIAVELSCGLALYSGRMGRIVWHVHHPAGALAGIGEVDGDGVPDVIAAGSGVARVLSGRNGRELLAVSDPDLPGFGRDVDALGDLDGDGYAEFLVVADVHAVVATTRPGGGSRVLATGTGCGSAGRTVRAVGDVDGDRYCDIAWVECPARGRWPFEGASVRVVSARTGETILVREAQSVESDGCFSSQGSTLAPAGDVDEDGRADILVAWLGACAFAFSGADGRILARYDFRSAVERIDGLGASIAVLTDGDGDRFPDVVAGCASIGRKRSGEALTVRWGSTGSTHVLHHSHRPGHDHFVAAIGDVDADGVGDVAVLVPECGSLTLNSGRDLGWIRTLHPPDG